jgi:hypothetical protein
MLVSNEAKLRCIEPCAVLGIFETLYTDSILKANKYISEKISQFLRRVSNVKVSQGARKLTTKLLPVFESSPVAILETDNSASFSFPLCAFFIFYSITLAQSCLGMGCRSGDIPLLLNLSRYIGIYEYPSSGLVDPPALPPVSQPLGSNAVPEDARELQLQDSAFKESVEICRIRGNIPNGATSIGEE